MSAILRVRDENGNIIDIPYIKGADGKDGVTPAISIGTIELLPYGSNPTASITGPVDAPVLNLGIPKDLPPITTDDNGKFLRVVDGAWVVDVVPTAEGSEF